MTDIRAAAYRPNQVANGVLPFGRTTVFRMIREGKLRTIKVGRARLIPADAIAEFLASDHLNDEDEAC